MKSLKDHLSGILKGTWAMRINYERFKSPELFFFAETSARNNAAMRTWGAA
ncbi:MAG: hypothetical protein OIN86_14070 [Candidatus Methanoperedens sp.]|nr:hypothetical protein [Candidatus Methanoperedens sp.]